MIQVVQTDAFAHGLNSLADIKAVARICARIRRLYFTRRGKTIVLLLCGGDKRTQSKDVKAAQTMVKEI
ncbi:MULTISPECIES: type II toxin-antitoxin system RelE/ParE family toxin [unclassified Bradyrhizobium]|uniref:type II toxin-antitoxin system RelE/ParE family toxin n=1 Tax=Bradyrhizobium sp. USDA 4541 TaxID=2817704 RepID=UPI0020A40335|nr:type II toxin-antitoxin system RelE/ParE family toxin [Bradyrhizobium sp. USDA 4541]MCP1850817.1 putative component of toxin-antitoxin plasmid stabilization module [Bradyrhizobium sp. USDA 4541]